MVHNWRMTALSVLLSDFLLPPLMFHRLASSGEYGAGVGLVRNMISAPPLYVCQIKLVVKTEVEKYLDKTFYDLCTLNLNDCKTYTHMRSIASERYGLNLTDPFLPDGSLDQGIDFIDVLRDLNCELQTVYFVASCRSPCTHQPVLSQHSFQSTVIT